MSGKTVVAQLPPMRKQDFAEFERTVPIWGQQRAIRRTQLQTIGAGALVGAIVGPLFTKARGNSIYVIGFAAVPFAVAGMALGHVASQQLFPSVATNKETRFVRRLWWANKCAQTW
eukprot:GGOE01042075.1.p2 GENE.GGOE01042075.1~~GGOE01042075.1.p2  ORF type:complete len:116 (-),score=8.32 GGOE01042075.1:203-550(-)